MFKTLLCTLFFLTTSLVFSQIKEIDSLIEKISDHDAYIVLMQTMSPRLKSDACNQIIAMGKNVTPELIKILDSNQKGIAAHFMLCKIWNESWNEAQCCNISNSGNVELATINGLEIQIEHGVLYSKPQNLAANKKFWKKFWHA